jgi:hypothetical protein
MTCGGGRSSDRQTHDSCSQSLEDTKSCWRHRKRQSWVSASHNLHYLLSKSVSSRSSQPRQAGITIPKLMVSMPKNLPSSFARRFYCPPHALQPQPNTPLIRYRRPASPSTLIVPFRHHGFHNARFHDGVACVDKTGMLLYHTIIRGEILINPHIPSHLATW